MPPTLMYLKHTHALIAICLLAVQSIAHGATSLTQNTVTWTFSSDHTVGQYANGEHWVLGPVTITSITPTSDGNRNGTVVNLQRGNEQGFDSRMKNSSFRSDWNIGNQLPQTIENGSNVISSISLASEASHINHPQIKTYAILTVVASVPPNGAFRPAYINGDHSHPWKESDLNYDALARKSIFGMGAPDIADRTMRVLINDQDPTWRGPPKRAEDASPSYGRDLANFVNTNLLLLNSDASNSAKRDLLVGMVQFGIDIHGILEDGGIWSADGGHNNGRMGPLIIAAMTLDSASMKAYLDASISPNFQEILQTFYVSQDDVNRSRHTSDGRPRTPYTSEDVGKPEWGEKHPSQPERDGDNWDAYYRDIAGGLLQAPAVIAELMGARDLINYEAFFEYAQRHIYYREGRFVDPNYYNDWDNGDDYGEGNTSKSAPFSSNETPPFHRDFYLAYENGNSDNGGGSSTDPPPNSPSNLLQTN